MHIDQTLEYLFFPIMGHHYSPTQFLDDHLSVRLPEHRLSELPRAAAAMEVHKDWPGSVSSAWYTIPLSSCDPRVDRQTSDVHCADTGQQPTMDQDAKGWGPAYRTLIGQTPSQQGSTIPVSALPSHRRGADMNKNLGKPRIVS